MIVLVSGGRDFDRESLIFDALDLVKDSLGPRLTLLVHGACGIDAEGPIFDHLDSSWNPGKLRGADKHAHAWALARDVKWAAYPAHWSKYGDKAGPKRNQEMVDSHPGLAVIFPGGTGTIDCVSRCTRAKVPTAFVRITQNLMSKVLYSIEWPRGFQVALF